MGKVTCSPLFVCVYVCMVLVTWGSLFLFLFRFLYLCLFVCFLACLFLCVALPVPEHTLLTRLASNSICLPLPPKCRIKEVSHHHLATLSCFHRKAWARAERTFELSSSDQQRCSLSIIGRACGSRVCFLFKNILFLKYSFYFMHRSILLDCMHVYRVQAVTTVAKGGHRIPLHRAIGICEPSCRC